MTQFILALLAFLALHSVPAVPAIRGRLVAALGRRVYLVLYSLASLVALAWVFHAAFQLDHVELWPPASWQVWVPMVLTPIAFFLLVAGLISPNPVSVSFRRSGVEAGAILAITRHPVLWGFILWAASHVVPNGDLRSLILFGVFALFAVFGIVMSERRNRQNALRQATSIVPFVAIAQGRARLRVDAAMLMALAVAAALTAWLLTGGHAALFGADPLSLAVA